MGFRCVGAAANTMVSVGMALSVCIAIGSAFAKAPAPAQGQPATQEGGMGSEKVKVLGEHVYPRVVLADGQSRFDPSSTLLVNALGAKSGMFGAAARDGITWANAYVPGTDRNGVVQLYALSASGNYGAFFGARSSDNVSDKPENVIGSIDLVVADSARPHLHWAHYSEGYVPPGKGGYRLLINDENSIQNEFAPAPSADPYNVNPARLLNNLRLDCGIGGYGAQSCTNPLSILNNGANYRIGILFGDRSIEAVDGAANALALPSAYALSWFGPSGASSWRIYAQAHVAGAGRIIMTDAAMSVELGRSSTPGLQITKESIASPAMIASGDPPKISGVCAVGGQRGGNTAGAFAFTSDCSSSQIVIGSFAAAPNGWACFASNQARGESVLRQVAFDQSSVTMDVSNARKSDVVVFSCHGF